MQLHARSSNMLDEDGLPDAHVAAETCRQSMFRPISFICKLVFTRGTGVRWCRHFSLFGSPLELTIAAKTFETMQGHDHQVI